MCPPSGARTGISRSTSDVARFTVYLDEERTRLIRSSRHTQGCLECGGYDTMELSLEDIQRAVA